MLQDVRARTSYLKRDLGELPASLPEVDSGLPWSGKVNLIADRQTTGP